ncbi:hypothetical protein P154DRAFT_200664 [Amniculicola lignicola CBS 123094]|uniref:Uncharacterized protein n=1 Tax=Amniculicola lignicola CBS 123094 TaxID=1392246 RepID=A0A6A5WHB4_9PLEO|nr:hypothetical protein P154DRAFT_200664 [Amniculicola lignicola CBS 123094]
MCQCVQYDSSTCHHSWLSLVDPCGSGRNLKTCPEFADGVITISDMGSPFPRQWAPHYCCPQCDDAPVDKRTIQMIKKRDTWATSLRDFPRHREKQEETEHHYRHRHRHRHVVKKKKSAPVTLCTVM